MTKYFNYTHNSGVRVSGGVTILIKNDIPYSKINIINNQAIAINVTLHKTMTIYSLYIPPNDDIDKNELKKLIDQLLKPFILLGNFNSHNVL